MILAYGWSVVSWLALVAPQAPELPDAPIQSAQTPAEPGEPSDVAPSDAGEPASGELDTEPESAEADAAVDAAVVDATEPSGPAEASDASEPATSPAAEAAPAADPFDGTKTSSAAFGDDERAPLEVEDELTGPEFDRRGLLIVLGVGLTHCAQAFCTPMPIGGVGRLELGYRLGRWAFVSTVVGGGGNTPDDEKDSTSIRSVRALDVAVGAQFFPVREGRFDPFLGATLGWARTGQRYEPESSTERQYASRGALRLSAGFAWYLGKRIALGPRIDAQLPFAGKWCTRFDDGEDEQCSSIRGEILDETDESLDKRQQRRAFPRMWTFTVDLRINI